MQPKGLLSLKVFLLFLSAALLANLFDGDVKNFLLALVVFVIGPILGITHHDGRLDAISMWLTYRVFFIILVLFSIKMTIFISNLH